MMKLPRLVRIFVLRFEPSSCQVFREGFLWGFDDAIRMRGSVKGGRGSRQWLQDGVRGKSVAIKATCVRCWEGD